MEDVKKVFISYSRTNDNHTKRIREIAEELVYNHGIDVILDLWSCKPGDDLNYFMEQNIESDQTDFVLLMCDKEYCEKANQRKGGVGKESTIISNDIYEQVTNSKFIPVFFEYIDGKPLLPIFCKSRNAINMTKVETDIEKVEEIARQIYNEPLIQKPKLGKKPNYSKTKSNLEKKIIRLKSSSKLSRDSYYMEVLKEFCFCLQNFEKDFKSNNNFEKALENLKSTLNLWQQFTVFSLEVEDIYLIDEVKSFYNELLQKLGDEYQYPLTKIFLYFSFLLFCSESLKKSKEQKLKELIYGDYYLSNTECNFTVLSMYPHALDYKFEYSKNVYREIMVRLFDEKDLKKLKDADSILYTISKVNPKFSGRNNIPWLGSLSFSYLGFFKDNKNHPLIRKFKSKDYFHKFQFLFGEDVKSVKKKLEDLKNEDNSYQKPLISNFIEIDRIAEY